MRLLGVFLSVYKLKKCQIFRKKLYKIETGLRDRGMFVKLSNLYYIKMVVVNYEK